MFRSHRPLLHVAALLVLFASCSAPPASTASNSPSSVATTSPSATATASAPPTSTATPIALPSFAQLSAPSANVVWALIAGTRLFRSTDRGDTWQERSAALAPFGPDREIAFISDTEGWLATPGQPGTQCTFQAVGIAHTVDAGARWEQLIVGALPGSADASGLVRQCKGGLAFADAQRGFLGAWDPNSAPVIHRTDDGGRTWSPSRPLPDPPGFTTRPAAGNLRTAGVRAFGATLLVMSSGYFDGQPRNYAFRSSDGGATWDYLATLPQPDGTFVFVSPSRWLQISLPGSSKESTDGGVTWHSFASDYSQAAGVAPQIVFGDALVGYATVRGGIQRTVDGGAHWTFLRTPGT